MLGVVAVATGLSLLQAPSAQQMMTRAAMERRGRRMSATLRHCSVTHGEPSVESTSPCDDDRMTDALSTPTPIVLVHGAWHGAWCFAALQAELDKRGVPSYAVDLPGHGISDRPLGDLHGDAACVADVSIVSPPTLCWSATATEGP